MKRCNYCGREIDDYAIFCQHCGANQSDRHNQRGNAYNSYNSYNTYNSYNYNGYNTGGSYGVENGSKGYMILAFFFPLVGAILWYMWRNTYPDRADSILKGATAAVAVGTPIVGLVAWFLMKDNYRYSSLAKHILKFSLIGVGIAVLWNIVLVVLYFVAPDVYYWIENLYLTYYYI